jgi:uncharacterized OsmC-like protein
MSQQTVEATRAKKERGPLNGVDTPTLFATINAVRDQPELARFKFRASSRWLSGTHSRSKSEGFYGAGGEHQHASEWQFDSDHPAVLVGKDQAPLPVEYLLYGLLACITSGIGNISAARGVKLTEVKSTIEGDMDLRGVLGLSNEVRNGYESLKVNFTIRGDAPPEKLREIVEQSRARSAVYDVLSNGVAVDITVDAR